MSTHRLSETTEQRLNRYAHARYDQGLMPTVLGYTVDNLISCLLDEVGF